MYEILSSRRLALSIASDQILQITDRAVKNHYISNFQKFAVYRPVYPMQIFVFERKKNAITCRRGARGGIENLSGRFATPGLANDRGLSPPAGTRDKITFRIYDRHGETERYPRLKRFLRVGEIRYTRWCIKIDSHVYVARRQARSIGPGLPYRQLLPRGVISRNCIVPHRTGDNCHR